MKIRIENGRREPVGIIELPEHEFSGNIFMFCYRIKVKHTRNTWTWRDCILPLRIIKDENHGWVIRALWKTRERLKNSGYMEPWVERR